MRTALVRSLIAGSFTAVATLSTLAISSTGNVAHAAEPCPPIVLSNGLVLPGICPPVFDPSDLDLVPTLPLESLVLCSVLDESALTVLASQTSPYDFRWTLSISSVPVMVCDEPIEITMVDLRTGATDTRETSVHELAGDFDLDFGTEHLFQFDTPCEYDTFVTIGADDRILAEYRDVHRKTEDCNEIEIPDLPELDLPEIPEVEPGDEPQPEDTPVDSSVPEQESQPTPPQGDLPRTGSDNSSFVAGLGVLVVGAGLGMTALVASRRRHV